MNTYCKQVQANFHVDNIPSPFLIMNYIVEPIIATPSACQTPAMKKVKQQQMENSTNLNTFACIKSHTLDTAPNQTMATASPTQTKPLPSLEPQATSCMSLLPIPSNTLHASHLSTTSVNPQPSTSRNTKSTSPPYVEIPHRCSKTLPEKHDSVTPPIHDTIPRLTTKVAKSKSSPMTHENSHVTDVEYHIIDSNPRTSTVHDAKAVQEIVCISDSPETQKRKMIRIGDDDDCHVIDLT